MERDRARLRAGPDRLAREAHRLRAEGRDLELRAVSLGEDAVVDTLSPYIGAAPRQEHKYFLATQQADEARHAVFFTRFMSEVADFDACSYSATLQATQTQLTWGFKKVFGRLDMMAHELREDQSRPKLAAAVTLYHIVVEAMLGQPGQHFIYQSLCDRDIMPGFREGMRNVALDEQRHIGFGVKILSDLAREDPSCRASVADILREVMPLSVGLLRPPNDDERYVECFGTDRIALGVEGMTSLDTKLRSAGLALETLPGPPILLRGLTMQERAERGQDLMKAGILGERPATIPNDEQTVGLLFDTMTRSLPADHGQPDGFTIQWEFEDAPDWRLRFAPDGAVAVRGPDDSADIRLRCRNFSDWVDIVAGRLDGRRALLTRRVRLLGGVRAVFRLSRLAASAS